MTTLGIERKPEGAANAYECLSRGWSAHAA